MIFKATCPVCGIFTRIESQNEAATSCACKAAMIIEIDTDYNTPEQVAEWQSTQSAN